MSRKYVRDVEIKGKKYLEGKLPSANLPKVTPMPEKTLALPGSNAKMEVMSKRYDKKQNLFSPEDLTFNPEIEAIINKMSEDRPGTEREIRIIVINELSAELLRNSAILSKGIK